MDSKKRLKEIQKRKQEINNQLSENFSDKKQRYVLTMDMYIYAESDEQALMIANDIVKKENDEWDNQAKILSVHSAPYGQNKINQLFP